MNVQQIRATLTVLRKGFEQQHAHPSSADEVQTVWAGLCEKAGRTTYDLVSTGLIALDGLPKELKREPVFEDSDDDDHWKASYYDVYWEAFVGWLSSTHAPVISTTGYPEAALAVYRPGMHVCEYSYRLDQRGFDHSKRQAIWPDLCETFAQAAAYLRSLLPDATSLENKPPQEPAIPLLDKSSPNWLNNKDAADLVGLDVQTLASYRRKSPRWVAKDRMSGKDRNGRMWRRTGTKYSHPWYYTPSLKSPTPS